MDGPQIAIAASPRDWSLRLHRHVADHGGARVRATALQPSDVLSEDIDVFLADDTTSFLTPRLVDDLHRRGVSVLGVFDPEDPRGKGDLVDMGADDVIVRGAPAEAFVAAVCALASERRRHAVDAAPPEPQAGPAPAPRAHLTAVGAVSGGCGATEVAIALTQTAAARGGRALLVDADEQRPSVAQRLGLPLYPNLRAAADEVEQGSGAILDTLMKPQGARFAVLAGLAAGHDWSQLRPAEVVDVLAQLARACTHLVANVGAAVEDLAALGGPARFGQTRAVVAAADDLVVVGSASPLGVARLLERAADLRVIAPSTPVHVLLNRAPSSSFQRGEVEQEIRRTLACASLTFAPPDGRVEAAGWTGTCATEGPFTRAVARMASAIFPPSPATVGRRARRQRTGAGR